MPGNFSGQISDRLASACDRLHGAASSLQLYLANTHRNGRSVRNQCEWNVVRLHRMGIRQENVHRDNNIAGNCPEICSIVAIMSFLLWRIERKRR